MSSPSWKPAASFIAPARRSRSPSAAAAARAFSSEVDTGSREENASNQNHRALLLIHQKRKGSSAGERLKEDGHGIDNPHSRNVERRHHRGPGADPAPDGFGLR